MNSLLEHIQSLESSSHDVDAWIDFFHSSSDDEKLLAIHLAVNNKKHRITNSSNLKKWVQEYTNLPAWIIDKSQQKIKDKIEGLSLILPRSERVQCLYITDFCAEVLALNKSKVDEKKAFVLRAWKAIRFEDYYLLNRIISGVKIQEIERTYLELALAQFFSIDINWIKYCLQYRLSQERSFDELFQLNDFEYCLLPSQFQPLIRADIENEIRAYSFVEFMAGERVQIVSNGKEFICWSYKNEIIEKYNSYIKNVFNADYGMFKIEGEIVQSKDETFFSLWKVHSANAEIRSVLKKNFGRNSVYFNSKEELLAHQKDEKNNKNIVGVLAIHENSNKFIELPTERLFFSGVLMYAQRSAQNNKQFMSLTLGLETGKEYISIGKVNWDALDEAISEELRQWILTNKTERSGPILVVPPKFVFELSCDYITSSPRHKSGYLMHDLRLEKSTPSEDLERITNISFLASNSLIS